MNKKDSWNTKKKPKFTIENKLKFIIFIDFIILLAAIVVAVCVK